MAVTIKQLIEKNKKAFDNSYFIESINLSYILINKALKQIVKDDLMQEVIDQKIKTSNLISHIKKELLNNPALKTKVSKKVIKDIELFIDLYKSIAKELGSRGIRSNAIAPGFIITEMTAKIPEDARKAWEANIPMKRGGEPDEVAKVCVFLGSDLSSYVSGQVINVCGAMNT